MIECQLVFPPKELFWEHRAKVPSLNFGSGMTGYSKNEPRKKPQVGCKHQIRSNPGGSRNKAPIYIMAIGNRGSGNVEHRAIKHPRLPVLNSHCSPNANHYFPLPHPLGVRHLHTYRFLFLQESPKLPKEAIYKKRISLISNQPHYPKPSTLRSIQPSPLGLKLYQNDLNSL